MFIAAIPASGATTIDTQQYSIGQQYLSGRAIGQSFVVPAGSDTHLDSVTFRVGEYTPGTGNIDVHVSKWDPALRRPTGPLLYTSTNSMLTSNVTLTQHTVDTGDLPLTPGDPYIFMVCSMHHQGSVGRGLIVEMVGHASIDRYAPGQLYAFANATTFSSIYTLSAFPGDDAFGFNDMSMTMTFVPEPHLVGVVPLAVIAARLKRRR